MVLFEDLADWDKTQTDSALHITAFGRRIATKSMTSPARRVAGPSVGGVELPLEPGWLVLAFASGGVLWLAVLAVRDGVPGRIRRRPAPAAVAALAAASLALPPRAWAGGNPGPGNTFIRFLFHDHLGTNVLVTNPNGNPVRRRVFEPFGKVIAEDGSEAPQRLFTGQRFEPESGLYDFRARWYDPEAGRFLSVDPVVQDAWDPQVFNAYSYVRNDPVNLVDPDGRFTMGFSLGSISIALHFSAVGNESSLDSSSGFTGGSLGVIRVGSSTSGVGVSGMAGGLGRPNPGRTKPCGEDACWVPEQPPTAPPVTPPPPIDDPNSGLLAVQYGRTYPNPFGHEFFEYEFRRQVDPLVQYLGLGVDQVGELALTGIIYGSELVQSVHKSLPDPVRKRTRRFGGAAWLIGNAAEAAREELRQDINQGRAELGMNPRGFKY